MIIERGGKSEERLFISGVRFTCGSDEVVVRKTDLPNFASLIIRHRARYMIAASFCRLEMSVLDFPCGSGYGSTLLLTHGNYEGRDNDEPTIEYAKRMYNGTFLVDDLTDPHLTHSSYDLIACIEGIEHIDGHYQRPLIRAFYEALKPGGILVVSSPENPEGVSGPSKVNQYHLWELTRFAFNEILAEIFSDVQILSHRDTLHNGQEAVCLYGICRKGKKSAKGNDHPALGWMGINL